MHAAVFAGNFIVPDTADGVVKVKNVNSNSKKINTKNMLFAAMFTALTAICAQLVIPLPMTQVQFSMVIMAVFLCGALLDVRYSVSSMLAYILLGICGMPVFGKFMGGVGVIAGPTGGYIAAYPFMTAAIWLVLKAFKKRGFIAYFVSMLASLAVCYILGAAWLSIGMNISFGAALMSGVVPFIAFDIIKIVIAAYLSVILSKRIKMN